MSRRDLLRALSSAALALAACIDTTPRRPNVVCIVVDDLGYADLGVQGSKDVRTPHIDSIANAGVRFRSGYVSAPQCSPSRAGLMTGRYQNRFGFEYNFGFAGSWDKGLDVHERTMADFFRQAGYATGMVGKWHLGQVDGLRPYERGFAETLWHPTGGVTAPSAETGLVPNVFRGADPAELREYSTDAFTTEAIEFIERHRKNPFFLFLAYNAPHAPLEARPADLQRFAHVEDAQRRAFLAMMASLDDNVGRLLNTLRETGLEDDTLLFLISDNGGATGPPRARPDAPLEPGSNTSSNLPFRGEKGDLLEGGIRIPFLIRWKDQIPAGVTYDEPVISLDILPTALAAAGVERPGAQLDGVDLLPFLKGERQGPPHDALYWRFDFVPTGGPPRQWAIRRGDWKLVKTADEPLALYDLAHDESERHDLAARHPGQVVELKASWSRWNDPMRPPAWPARPQ